MGQPGCSSLQSSYDEHIVIVRETRGTETSKYPEEKKDKSILQVAASERGTAQTIDSSMGFRTSVTRVIDRRTLLESKTAGGNSPVF